MRLLAASIVFSLVTIIFILIGLHPVSLKEANCLIYTNKADGCNNQTCQSFSSEYYAGGRYFPTLIEKNITVAKVSSFLTKYFRLGDIYPCQIHDLDSVHLFRDCGKDQCYPGYQIRKDRKGGFSTFIIIAIIVNSGLSLVFLTFFIYLRVDKN